MVHRNPTPPSSSFVALAALALALAAGCGEPSPPVGSERGACYGNGTCDEGLLCMSRLCVAPPPPDCAKVAEKLNYLMLDNYAKQAERDAYIADMTTTCKQATLTQPDADCILAAKTRQALRKCPKPLALGSCAKVLKHARKLVAGDNPALTDMLDHGPALQRCQQRGISKRDEQCVLRATSKQELDRCGRF